MGLRVARLPISKDLRLVALLAALGVPACSRDVGDVGAPAATAAGPRGNAPSIVLLCMDTLRADGLGTAPDGTEWMPALCAFARDATVFRDASSSSSWTAPSVATLLTGLESARTGVRGARTAGALPASVTTLPEALRARGYTTAAITSGGWVSSSRGLGQGFDSFSADFDLAGPEAEIATWQRRRPKDAPFFLFLHTCAAHDPYGPKQPLRPSDCPPEVAARASQIVKQTSAAGWRLPAGAAPWLLEQFLFSGSGHTTIVNAVGDEPFFRLWDLSTDWLDGEGQGTPELAVLLDRAPAAYRGGLAHADAVFARTMAALNALSLPDDTVLCVVGDHGEAFGEHGTLSHGRLLYDEFVRVPLVVRAPGRLPAAAGVEGSCGLVDVTPTLLALAGAAVLPSLDGRSLLPLAAGEAKGHPVFAEEDRNVLTSTYAYGVRVVSVRTEAAKYLITYVLGTQAILHTELYDLAADPGENTPLVGVDPGRFGEAFCEAARKLRVRVPGMPLESSCVVAVR